jgi:uncharacterized protein
MTKKERVVLIGASAKPQRYAYQALKLLSEYGHHVLPVNPKETLILGHVVYAHLEDITGPIDTVTMYVGSEKSSLLEDSLLTLRPKRVIFNPGAENKPLADTLMAAGILCLDACTLVLLKTSQF